MSRRSEARARRDEAALALERTVVRAPVSGTISQVERLQVGQMATPGQAMVAIVAGDETWIEANFKETQVALMRVGQPVTIKVDALDGAELRGRVASFSPGTGAQFSLIPPENATGNFTKIVQRIPVRIAVDADAQTRALLVPGMSVDVTVDTRSAKGALKRIAEQQEQHNEARQGAQGR